MTPVLYGKGMLSWGKNDKVEKSILSFFIAVIKNIKNTFTLTIYNKILNYKKSILLFK